jgi:MFS superfamily sulfate permease-like transporter
MSLRERLRFDRRELSGAFGDVGTDLPLMIGILRTTGLHVPSALFAFGLMQIMTGLIYGIPMAVQPLKAMAVIVIAQKLPASALLGGGLAIGISMLVLTVSGTLSWLGRYVPRPVIRGIQLGLALQLSMLALKDYLPKDSQVGYVLAAFSATAILVFRTNRRLPITPLILLAGVLWAIVGGKLSIHEIAASVGFHLPRPHLPTLSDVITGFVTLAIPQLPLSIGNSVLATQRLAQDLFPHAKISHKKIGYTYSLMNLIIPFLGGIPTCHGCGGLAGMHFFGGRTGGAPVIYGLFYITLGLMFGGAFDTVVKLFPLSLLGVILMFEAIALMQNITDVASDKRSFFLCCLCGVCAAYLPNGYVIALLGGIIVDRLLPPYKEFCEGSRCER